MHRDGLQAKLIAGMQEMGQSIDETQAQALVDYLELLSKWNKVYNLTAVRDAQQMVTRHLLDSLSILPYLEGERILDVGSGAGLPGIPLAVMQPERAFVLNDALGKRTTFLKQVVQALSLENVRVEHARVEDLSLAPFPCVVARAFSSIEQLVQKTLPLCAPGGCWLFMAGQVPAVDFAQASVEQVQPLEVPGEKAQRHVVVVRKQN